jgi:HK97 family phage major capsid protein
VSELERLDLEVKFTAGDAGLVAGYASLFGKPADSVRDIVAPGAFAGSIARCLPEMLREHKGEAIGEWMDVTEDELGLRVTGRFDLTSPAGRAAHADVVAGRLDGLSIGYRATKSDRAADGVRTLREVDLAEISVVRRPASSRARILSVKSSQEDPMSENTTQAAEGGATVTPDALKAIADRLAAIETKSADAAKITSRLDEIEKKLARPAISTKSADEDEKALERKAFLSFVRHGIERMAADEAKALTVSSDASAGYLAPEAFGEEILKKLVEFSPIRQYARVISIGAPTIKYPRRISGPAAVWTDEQATSTESTPVYEQIGLTPYELRTFVDVSQALLEDNAYNIEGELAADLAEAFGVAEGTAFVSGDGTGKPKGIVAASGIAQMKTGNAATLGTAPADTIIGLYHSLPTAHAQRGVWLMNRTTLGALRLLKDTTGRFLLADPVSAGMPLTLLGRPIVEAVDMPSVAANAIPIVFGDLQGYRIVDRVSFSMLRDPYSQAAKGNVRLHARRRVGGDVTNPDRFVALKVAV